MVTSLRPRGNWLAWASVIATVALFIAGNALRGATSTRLISPENLKVVDGWWIRLSPLYALAFAFVGALIVARRPGNRVGWVACGIGLLTALYEFGLGYETFGTYVNRSLPALGFVSWLEVWEWVLPVILMLFFLPLLFPDGKPISPRWWLLAPLVLVGFGLGLFGIHIGQVLGVIGTLLANVSLFIRFRRAGPDQRQQIRWFAFAGLVLAIVAVSGLVAGAFIYHNNTVVFNPIFDVLTPLAFTALAASLGIAVLKYHLYDIDVFLRQALVYGTLVVLISIVYFVTVVTVGSRVGQLPRNDPAAGVAVGAIVALAFQPVRRRLQRLANRLVYGKRATPYEVLSQFSKRVSEMYASEELPLRMAQVLAEGTTADSAAVWLRVGHELRRAASWPAGATGPSTLPLPSDELPPIPGAAQAVPVRYQGELLGALAVSKRQPMTAAESRLLADLSREAGLVLKNTRLTAELVQRLDELQASRQRLVSAQDTERRRLERNLHDGAQQNLVALKLKIALMKNLATTDPLRAQAALDELTGDANEAIETLRELARGLYPPILAQDGLVAAVEAQARRTPVPVEVVGGPLPRYSQEMEAGVYFCVLEALQNIVKHANATKATVSIEQRDGRLIFSVTDDGRGLDPARARSGSGMQNMRDRIEVLGGGLQVESPTEGGTRVTGSIPVVEAQTATPGEPLPVAPSVAASRS
jgi:signal transduction histidine kinase